MDKDGLKKLDIFSKLDNEGIDKLYEVCIIKSFNKDNIIFYEGDFADKFHLLLLGHIKLYKTGPKANEIVLHHFFKPTLVAEMPVFEQINFPATAVALKDETKIAIIKKDDFLKLLSENPDFSYNIIKSLTSKIRTLEMAINRNIIFDSMEKVCSLLKENPNVFKEHKNVELAAILNMAPETLSRTIKKLKKVEILSSENIVKNEKLLDMYLSS